MILLNGFQLGLLCILDGQTGLLAALALAHYSPTGRQGAGYRYWAARRDAALRSLETAMELITK